MTVYTKTNGKIRWEGDVAKIRKGGKRGKMQEEIWRAYLETLSEEEMRLCARLTQLPVRGYRKGHLNTPRKILFNNFSKHPLLSVKMPELWGIREKIKEETENQLDKIQEQLEEFFTQYGALKVIAALSSSEEEELRKLGEEQFAQLGNEEKTKAKPKPEKIANKLESQLEDLHAQVAQLEKKVKRVEKVEKEWKNKYEILKTKYDKDKERWKKKSDSYDQKVAKKEEETTQWMDKCIQLEAELAKMQNEKAKLEKELDQSCLEVLILGTEKRLVKRKRIGSELVNLSYIDCQKHNGLSELVQDKDYILLQSTSLPNLLRTNIYTWCLKAGKQPLEIAGEEELMEKLERVLGAER